MFRLHHQSCDISGESPRTTRIASCLKNVLRAQKFYSRAERSVQKGFAIFCDKLDRRTCILEVSHDIRLCLFARFKAT